MEFLLQFLESVQALWCLNKKDLLSLYMFLFAIFYYIFISIRTAYVLVAWPIKHRSDINHYLID